MPQSWHVICCRLALYLGSMLRSTVALHNLINNKMRNKQQKAGKTQLGPSACPAFGLRSTAGESCGAKGRMPAFYGPWKVIQLQHTTSMPLHGFLDFSRDACPNHRAFWKDKEKKEEAKKEKEEAGHASSPLVLKRVQMCRASECFCLARELLMSPGTPSHAARPCTIVRKSHTDASWIF